MRLHLNILFLKQIITGIEISITYNNTEFHDIVGQTKLNDLFE